MQMVKNIGYGLVIAAIGAGVGYYYAPDKIKIEEKIVERERVVKETEKEVVEKYDPTTGKLVERIVRDRQKDTNSNTSRTEKKEEKTKERKHYAAKVGIVQSLNKAEKPTYRVGAEMRLPLFNLWLGGEADIDVSEPKLGGYLRMEF